MNENSSRSITLIIPGSLEFLRIVDGVTNAVADYVGFGEDERNAVAISVIEASTNAIQHGCGSNEAKRVVITFDFDDAVLRVTVLDPGSGFDPGCTVCDLHEGLVEPRGRGLAIIKSLMDDVEFQFEGGTSVTMTKRKSAPTAKTGT